MKVLLDTCTVLWATLAPGTLTLKAQQTIANPENTILVSAVSAWEISTKVRLGRLPGAEKLEQSFIEVMEQAGYTLLDVDMRSALRAGRLTAEHRNPFDRMIAAQALGMDIAVVTPDAQLEQFGVRRVW